MIILIKTLQVILALSILILIHELGHFAFAKMFGIRVDKFYLFFDVGGFKLFSFKIGDTEFICFFGNDIGHRGLSGSGVSAKY